MSQIGECFKRLDEVARHVIEVPPYKVLASETGMDLAYLTNVMARLIKIRRTGIRVSKAALMRALSNAGEFEILMSRLSRKKARVEHLRGTFKSPEVEIRP